MGRQERNNLIGKPLREALPELAGQGYLELLDTVYRTGESHVGPHSLVRLDRAGDGTLEARYFNFVYQPSKDVQGRVKASWCMRWTSPSR